MTQITQAAPETNVVNSEELQSAETELSLSDLDMVGGGSLVAVFM